MPDKTVNIPPPPSGQLVIPQNKFEGIPKPPSGDILYPEAEENNQEITKFVPVHNDDFLDKASKTWSSGWGSVASSFGAGLEWIGHENDAASLTDFGKQLKAYGNVKQIANAQEISPDIQEFDVSDFMKPDFYSQKIVGMLPAVASLIAPSVVAGAGGAAAGAAIGTAITPGAGTAIGGLIGGAVAAAGVSRTLEGVMEAGGVWTEVINDLTEKGIPLKEAQRLAGLASAETFKKGYALTGLDAVQFALAFAPLGQLGSVGKFIHKMPKAVKIGAVVGAEVGTEALEEGVQQWNSSQALNRAKGLPQENFEDWIKKPENREAIAMGGVGGLLFAGAGVISPNIISKVEKKNNDITIKTEELTQYMDALDAAQTPEEKIAIQQKVRDNFIIDKVVNGESKYVKDKINEVTEKGLMTQEDAAIQLASVDTYDKYMSEIKDMPINNAAKKEVFGLINRDEFLKNEILDIASNEVMNGAIKESKLGMYEEERKGIPKKIQDIFSGNNEIEEPIVEPIKIEVEKAADLIPPETKVEESVVPIEEKVVENLEPEIIEEVAPIQKPKAATKVTKLEPKESSAIVNTGVKKMGEMLGIENPTIDNVMEGYAKQKDKLEIKDGKIQQKSIDEEMPFVHQFINAGMLNSVGKIDPRVNLEMPTADVNKGIADINSGKNTAAARNLTAKIKDIKSSGVVPWIEDTGGMSRRTDRKLSEFQSFIEQHPAEPIVSKIEEKVEEESPFHKVEEGVTIHTSEERKAQIVQLQKAMPKVTVVEDETLGDGKAGRLDVDGKTVRLNPKYNFSETPIHEFGHALIDMLGGLNNKFIRKGVEQLKGTKLWERVEKAYPELSPDMLAKEVLTTALGKDGVGVHADNAKRGVFKMWLNNLWNKIKRLTGMEKNVAKNLATQLLSGKKIKGETKASSKSQEHIIGIKKAILNKEQKDALSQAEAMEIGGKSANKIYYATGFERGIDGEWNYDLIENKNDFILDKEFLNSISLNPGDRKFYKFNNLFEDTRVIKVYPDLKNIIIKIYKTDENATKDEKSVRASFDSSKNELGINYDFIQREVDRGNNGMGPRETSDKGGDETTFSKYISGRLRENIIHEVQHAIQDIEGFPSGGTPSLFDTISKSEMNEEIKAIGIENDLEAMSIIDELIKESNDAKYLKSNLKSKGTFLKNNNLIKLSERIDPIKKYLRITGEVQSRNASERLKLTAEERRNKSISEIEDKTTPRKDQIIRYDKSVQESKVLSEDTDEYSKNFEIQKDKLGKFKANAGTVLRSAKDSASNLLAPISTVLENIHPALKKVLRKFEFDYTQAIKKDYDMVKPFLDKTQAMSKEDYADFDLARKNGDKEMIDTILDKYDMKEEYKVSQEMLDKIYDRATAVGYKFGYKKDYAPRAVKDAEAFFNYMQEKHGDSFTVFEKAIFQKENELNKKMTIDEKANFINNMLRGYGSEKIALGKTGAMKERAIDQVDAEMNQFYYDSNYALAKYINDTNEAIEGKRFFGKGSSELGVANTKESIGFKLLDVLSENNTITAAQAQEVLNALDARFNRLSPNKFAAGYKNLAYIDVLGSPMAPLTQLQDLALTMYRSGILSSGKQLGKSITRKSEISTDDLGLKHIIAEYAEGGSAANAVDKVFRLVGLTKMDRLGKETFVNGVIEKYRSQARNFNNLGAKEQKQFLDRIHATFDAKTAKEAIKDLKGEGVTENIKMLAFNELLDVQPVTYSEYPVGYLKGGNGRLFYMLKSYQLKLFDIYRREVGKKISSPNKADKIQGYQNLFRLTAMMTVMGIGVDALKDLLLNKDQDDMEDRVAQNVVKLAGFNEYDINTAKKEGLGKAASRKILPPFRALDNIGIDLYNATHDKEVKGKSIQSIPLIGQPMYNWWFRD